jgi:hypothetical protein
MLQIPHGGSKSIGEGGHVDDTALTGHLEELLSLPGTQTERFFTENVIARLHRGENNRVVHEVGRGYNHGIDLRMAADLSVVGRVVSHPPVANPPLAELLISIANSCQFGPGIKADTGFMLELAHSSGADDT